MRSATTGPAFTLALSDGTDVTGAALLVATGRRTDLAGIGAGVLGVDEGARALPVDDHLRVAPGVWAVGDITGHGAFTHMSMYQANIAVHDILGEHVSPAEYHAVPRVTFTDPEIGSVGLSEARARYRGLDVRTSCYPIPDSARGWIHKAGNNGFIKLVADAGQGILVGASSAGPAGCEVLGILTLAVHARVSGPAAARDDLRLSHIPPGYRVGASGAGPLEAGPSGAGPSRSRALRGWPFRSRALRGWPFRSRPLRRLALQAPG